MNLEEQETQPEEQTQHEQTHEAEEKESPSKCCKKSPIKSLEDLECKDKTENQENIETTYLKCHKTQSVEDEDEETPEEKPMDPKFFMPETAPAKTILGQQNKLQDVNDVTETQLQQQVVDINELLDVDSNVINYGQFICGKILGSTLLVTNLSSEELVIDMKVSAKKEFNCEQIFGQYNRNELPF